jgi:hypothetical protein
MLMTILYGLNWIQLSKFCLDSDVYICFAYIPPDKSSSYTHDDSNLFDVLQKDVECFKQMGHVCVGGDLNGRIAERPDWVENDFSSVDEIDLYRCDEPLRQASMDKQVNSFGPLVLDMCRGCGLRVLNGRCGSDTGGMFICVNERDQSVVDYVLSSVESMHLVSAFAVGDLTEHSDHAPVSFALRTGPATRSASSVQCNRTADQGGARRVDTKWRWDSAYPYSLREALTMHMDDLNNTIKHVVWSESESVSSAVESFTNKLQDVCRQFFGKHTKHHTNRYGFKNGQNRVHSAPWFNAECVERKNEYLDALKCFNISRSCASRQQMYTKKKL